LLNADEPMARTILVVEDDDAARRGLVALLTDAGYRTFDAATLKKGRELLARENPDLVIVDVRLGGDNGLQLVAMAPRPIPAIVTTGFRDASLEADARQFGAEFLVKPVAPSVLLKLIEQKLAGAAEQPGGSSRRWPRRHVSAAVDARMGDSPARIIDVGYGGVRLELEAPPRDMAFPTSVLLTLPGKVSVGANVVWNRLEGAIWQCGAAIAEEYQPVWRDVVDALA
jgi:DNA-binding response OmpR family regulator